MRFIPLFKLPQTEHYMVTWKSRKNKTKKKRENIFPPCGYSEVCSSSSTLRDAFPLSWTFAANYFYFSPSENLGSNTKEIH